MPRGKKKGESVLTEDKETRETEEEQDLPKDEAGRLRIKKNYEELLGIRIEKLRGRILNRERINKAVEGIYFICAECRKVCHSLDEGLVADPKNEYYLCTKCAKERIRRENGKPAKIDSRRATRGDEKESLRI